MATARHTTGAIQLSAGVLSIVNGMICIYNYYRYPDLVLEHPLWLASLFFGALLAAVGVLLVVLGWRKI